MQLRSSITRNSIGLVLAFSLLYGLSVAGQNTFKGDNDCIPGKKNRDAIYQVALLIPLYLEQVADTLWVDNLDPAKIGETQPFRFIQFYHGFMLAADSLSQKGLKVEISVYDVDQNPAKLKEVLQKQEMEEMDLIVGPFFKNSFALAAEFAKVNKIPIINPLSSRSDILDENPYVFKLLPSVESQPEIVASLVSREFSDYKIIMYVANQMQGADMIGKYKEAIEREDETGARKVTIVDYASDSIQGFRNFASRTKPNLVIIYAENEVLPAVLLSKLAGMKDEYQVSVIGLPEFDKFTNIESSYLIALKAHVFMASYMDATSEEVKGFIRSYRARYFDEPQFYAQDGFDAGYFFLSALMSYGREFENCIDMVNVRLIQNEFHFVQKSNGGYDNVNWNVLQYFDYFLLKKSFY